MMQRFPARVMITADAIGGVWTYVVELARGLGRRGIEVLIAVMGRPLAPDQVDSASKIPNLEIIEGDYRLEWMQDPWEDLERSSSWLLELKDQFEPDVVHLNGYVHGSLPWDTPVLVVGHSCVLSWWLAVKGEKAPAEWSRYRAAVTDGLRAADLVVAPSRAMLGSLIRQYGPLAATRVIPNGRRGDIYRPALKEPIILAVGRIWDEAKNIGLLERSAPEISWPIYVAGEWEHPEAETKEWRGITLLGRLTEADLAPWFGKAAVYSLPARYEPFGYTPLEAALAGCALVLGDIPSLRETWSDAALFVAPEDEKRLASHLNRLASDDQLRKTMAARALARARSFTPELMVSSYIEAYHQIAG